ncbi:MAG: FtsX-like permease family protein [Gammaproteobacteria bacterium]|nr:MAG: FtsX-like permease family protein [Gammaproteobacteria bacterium]
MRGTDSILLAFGAIRGHRLRSSLTILGMGIGVSAVVLLTSLGNAARSYVTGEFSELGANMVIVLPGRNETTGGIPPIMGETPRDLTLDDALALGRSPVIREVAPVMLGSVPVSARGLEREVTVIGTTSGMEIVRNLRMARGRFLAAGDPHLAAPECVLGETVRKELFGADHSLGEWLRIGDRRCRIIGVLAPSGVSLGSDLDDMVMLPVASAEILFNTSSLFRVLLQVDPNLRQEDAAREIRRIIMDRHEGEDDITIISQDSVLATFDRILLVLTLGIGAIAGISLAVAGILIMNIMLVSVTQRTAEIGLLRAIGAPAGDIRRLFLIEALLLSGLGTGFGLLAGILGAVLLHRLYPLLPLAIPAWSVAASAGTAMLAGLVFGALPAIRAARLNPVTALTGR